MANRVGEYRVVFLDTERAKEYELHPETEAEFRQYPTGSTHECLYSLARGVDCGELNGED